MKRQHAKTWQHSIRAFLRLSRQILFSALLCFTIWTTSPDAYATSPKTTSPAVTQQDGPKLQQGARTDGAEAATLSPSLLIYLLATGVALLMFCAYILHRARQ